MATRSAPLSPFQEFLFHFTQRRVREVTGLIWFGLSLFIAASLISYHPDDPSLNVASDTVFHNWLGSSGAITTDFLLQSFGLSSLLIIIALLGWGWRQSIAHQPIKPIFRSLCLLLSVISASYLLTLLPTPANWPFQSGLGGAAGSIVKAQLPTPLFQAIGAGILAVLFISLWNIASAVRYRQWKEAAMRVAQLAIGLVEFVIGFFHRSTAFKLPKISEKLSLLKDVEDIAADSQSSQLKSRKKHIGSKEESQTSNHNMTRATSKRVQKSDKKGEQTSLILTRREKGYALPDTDLLKAPPKQSRRHSLSDSALEQNARLLESVLHDFGVKGDIIGIRPGPVVTLYELEPAAGTKSSRVIGLSDDIARSMSAISARISVIPGRNAMGIELPNSKRETVYLREMLEDKDFSQTDASLPMALGKDIGGDPITVDLAKMPHLLVAGTTGSGKSVAINTMIASLLYHHTPEECKFIMIDPKMLELSVYEGIPHLLCPVVTEPPKAVVALKWVVKEMENRYRLMANLGVRNMAGYNKRLRSASEKGEELKRTVQTGFDPETGKPIYEDQPIDMTPLPFIVVIVDEMADLMLVAGKDIEGSIQRLAQMARAAGIHIIMATQRPSVDVITGVVKANFPTRISFQVTSRIDSRTILGDQGAEQLLGMGDMLYMAGGGKVTRVHGPFVSDKEIEQLVTYLKSQGEPDYVEEVTIDPEEEGGLFDEGGEMDEETRLYQQAVAIVRGDGKASTSFIQRKLKIGYNRAARLIDRMEEEGIVSPANHTGKREVL
jgi:S-DNA-T family DNA segregation ATPase FtsK/SpoIIIE